MQQEYLFRRQKLLTQMKPNSAALIFAAPEVTRSNDIKYHYRQNSDFWYFTGFNEPEAVLVLIKNHDKNNYSVIFNRARDLTTTIWFGHYLGQTDALKRLNVQYAVAFNEINNQLYKILNNLNAIYHAQGEYKYSDQIVFDALNKLRKGARHSLVAPTSIIDWRPIVHEMRLFKSTKELNIIRHASKISTLAHIRAMRKCNPGMFEYQLESEVQYEFHRNGARFSSYDTIVGSGKNGCILHYIENKSKLCDGDLVLIDAGCEYQGYAIDITRTFPINGKFTSAQRSIYNIVLNALETALILFRPGISIEEVTNKVVRIIVLGLIELGILRGQLEAIIANNAYNNFFMHSLSHWLGLDVHDVGNYGVNNSRILQPGMVLTVEPGLYIASDAEDVPDKYRGIGIRIEDDIVITNTGNENLTNAVVKRPDDIEYLMRLRR